MVEEKMLERAIKLTINRKDKPELRIYFENVESVKEFHSFLDDLIEGVKKKVSNGVV